nr:hypothetical protein [uncultured Draconibacterium sp.]
MKNIARLIIIALLCFGVLACSTQKRVTKNKDKLTDIIQREAIYYDVDFANITSGNLSGQYMNELTKSVLDVAPESIRKDLAEFMKSYAGPELKEPSVYLIDEVYASVQKSRSARWSDALMAFGEGLQGETADQNAMASNMIRNKREMLYLKLKEIDNRNNAILDVWERYFFEDLQKFVALKMATQKDGWVKFKDEVEYISM